MEEVYNLNCLHQVYTEESHFCYICGAIKIDDSFAIKPNKHKHRLEIDPCDILASMIKQEDTLSLNNLISTNSTGMIKNYLNRRKKIMKKLKYFIDKYKFKEKSYHLAVFLLDIVISKYKFEKQTSLESLAIGCVILAIKYVEVDTSIPDLTYFQTVFENLFFRIEEIRTFEVFCLKILQFNLNFVTLYDYIEHFIAYGIIFTDDLKANTLKEMKHYARLYEFLYEIVDFTIENVNYLQYTLFHVACSCLYISREIVKNDKETIWNNILEKTYGIRFQEFEKTYEFVKTYSKYIIFRNYFNMRNSGDVICLYINNEPAAENKKKPHLPPSGLKYGKDSGKDLKIFETKRIILETFSINTFKVLKEKKAKSQDHTTTDYKNIFHLHTEGSLVFTDRLRGIDSHDEIKNNFKNKVTITEENKSEEKYENINLKTVETYSTNITPNKKNFNISLNVPNKNKNYQIRKILGKSKDHYTDDGMEVKSDFPSRNNSKIHSIKSSYKKTTFSSDVYIRESAYTNINTVINENENNQTNSYKINYLIKNKNSNSNMKSLKTYKRNSEGDVDKLKLDKENNFKTVGLDDNKHVKNYANLSLLQNNKKLENKDDKERGLSNNSSLNKKSFFLNQNQQSFLQNFNNSQKKLKINSINNNKTTKMGESKKFVKAIAVNKNNPTSNTYKGLILNNTNVKNVIKNSNSNFLENSSKKFKEKENFYINPVNHRKSENSLDDKFKNFINFSNYKQLVKNDSRKYNNSINGEIKSAEKLEVYRTKKKMLVTGNSSQR